jgi:hypothetical protein
LEKITVVVAIVVLGLAPAVGMGTVRAAPAALLVAVLVVTVSAGMDLVLRGEARYHPTLDLFILPAMLVIGAALFLPLFSSGTAIVAGLAIFGALLFAVFWAEHTVRQGLADRRGAQTVLTLVGYVAAFVLYAAIYQSKTRSLISAPAIVAVTLLLTARHLRLVQESRVAESTSQLSPVVPKRPDGPRTDTTPASAALGASPTSTVTPSSAELATLRVSARQQRAMMPGWPRTLVYSAVVALATGEVTWALNYWPLNGLFGGAFLLSTFYFLVGVLAQHLQSRLTRRVAVEHGVVAAAGAILIIVAGLLRTPS